MHGLPRSLSVQMRYGQCISSVILPDELLNLHQTHRLLLLPLIFASSHSHAPPPLTEWGHPILVERDLLLLFVDHDHILLLLIPIFTAAVS